MSKKKLRNRIDTLFEDLGSEAIAVSKSGKEPEPSYSSSSAGMNRLQREEFPRIPPGWNWECDVNGCYTFCSSEVVQILGRNSEEFIGQPVKTYSVLTESSEVIESAFNQDDLPIEIEVSYLTKSEVPLLVRFYIVSRCFVEGQEERTSGWRGYVQKISPTEESGVDLINGENIAVAGMSSSILPVSASRTDISSQVTPSLIVVTTQPQEPISGEATLAVPFQVQQTDMGVLEVIDDTPGRIWSGDERRLVEQVVDQLSLALDNAKLFQETQVALTETKTLYSITSAASRSLELKETLADLLREVIAAVNVDAGLISMVNQATGELELIVEQSLPKPMVTNLLEKGLKGTLYDIIYRRKEALFLPDFNKSNFLPAYIPDLNGLIKLGFLSYLGVPLESKGKVLGTLCTFGYKARPEQSAGLSLMQVAGQQIGIAIENAQLFQETQSRANQLEVLNEMGRELSATLEVNEIAQMLYTYTTRLMATPNFFTAFYNARKEELSFPVVYIDGIEIEPSSRKLGSGLSEYIIRSHESLLLNGYDIPSQMEKLGVKFIPLGNDKPPLSWLGVPLLYGEEILGVVVVQSIEIPYLYLENDRRVLAAIASQAAIAIQNARLFQQTQSALGETAGLYQASAEINTAQNYDEILGSLRRNTTIGMGAHIVSINYYDRPWTKEIPEWIDILSMWSEHKDQELMTRYPLAAYPSLVNLLQPTSALILDDIPNDPRLDEITRELFSKLLNSASALFVPLVVGNQWIGHIIANYPEHKDFPEGDIQRLMALVGQAAVAIQNLRSVSIAEQRAHEASERSEQLGLVNRVVSAMVSSSDLRQVLDAVASELVKAFKLTHAGIALLSSDHTYLTTVAEKSSLEDATVVGMKIPVKGNPSAEQVLQTRLPLIIAEAQKSPLLAPIQVLIHERGIQTIAIFPIIAGGEAIGIINLDVVEKGRLFTAEEITLAETLVGQISTSIQNANLYEQTQQALAETETLYRASAELNVAQNYQDILDILRNATILGNKNVSNITINLFDRPWTGDEPPEWYNLIARWTSLIIQTQPANRYPMSHWTTSRKLLIPDAITIIENALTDSRLDEAARALYVDRMDAKSLLFAPIYVGGQWFGHIDCVYSKTVHFVEQDTRILMAIVSQAAVAIQNLRLLEETRRRATQLETAAEIARDTSSTLALDILLERAVKLIRERYGFYHSSIFLLDEQRINAVVRASTGAAGDEMLRRNHKLGVGSQSLVGLSTESGSPVIVNDVDQNLIYRQNPFLPDTKAELVIPLKIGKRIIGALDVQSIDIDAFSTDDVAVLQTLADQIAVAVDNAQSYAIAQQAIDETRRRVQELSVLFELSRSLASAAMETDEITNIIGQYFIKTLDVPEVSISLLDIETGEYKIITDLIHEQGKEEPRQLENIGNNLIISSYPSVGKVLQTLKPQVIQASDNNLDPLEAIYLQKLATKTMVVLPLAVKGSVFGIIELKGWDQENSLSTDQLNLAMTLANSGATAIENARLFEESKKTAEQLREVDKLKSQFLANMSHELRTPLNSIIGFSRVILKGIDGPISDLQKQDLAAINSAGQHLLQLINDILDISKIEAGKMELAFDDSVNLADLITSAMSTAVGLTKDKPITLHKEIPDDLPLVRADSTRIRQVLINLFSNASKFTEEGSITVKANQQIGLDGRPEIMVSVIDTGPGIAKADQTKLFQPFSQVDASTTRKVGGSGLGLSVSRLLVELHEGRIGVDSEPGKGSTFYFTLPLSDPEIAPEAELSSGGDISTNVILAIDDDRQVLNLYERYLVDHGYQVIPLTDPTKAVEAAHKHKPFAITLDVMMPKIDGWQVLTALKQDPETRTIPVVICSILENQEKGFSLGAVGYLSKPILEEDLIKAINRLNGDGSIQEILVVDDDLDDLRLVQKILQEKSNYRVRIAHGGPEGLAAIQTHPPNAIILDLFMPEIDGFALLETARGDSKLAEIPVIIFTAGDLNEEQRIRLAEFSNKMLHKSNFKEEDLLISLETALRKLKTE